ncbi:MAG: hypothetical protein ACI8QS_002621 [Planctomycetota bacterium]|jgi:hypothetical protein
MRLLCPTLLIALSTSCASGMPQWEDADPDSEGIAQALLERSVSAVQGPNPVTELRVQYEGTWGFWVKRFQPVLTDAGYRRTSTEILRPQEDVIEQLHVGPDGEKIVRWDGSTIEAVYNGEEPADEAQERAAALVAEGYQLFLLGPRYLATHAVGLRALDAVVEDGRTYERLIARLSPGLGFSEEDFVVLWVDAETDMPLRVHFTLEGLESTRGAHADTTYLTWVRVNGHAFPTEYVEHVRGPLGLKAHEWRVVNLEVR